MNCLPYVGYANGYCGDITLDRSFWPVGIHDVYESFRDWATEQPGDDPGFEYMAAACAYELHPRDPAESSPAARSHPSWWYATQECASIRRCWKMWVTRSWNCGAAVRPMTACIRSCGRDYRTCCGSDDTATRTADAAKRWPPTSRLLP